MNNLIKGIQEQLMTVLKKRYFIRVLSITLFSVTSCSYDYIELAEINLPETVSFDENIIPIFEKSCASCHNNLSNPPVLLKEEAYQELISGNYLDLINPDKSNLIIKINSGHPDNETPNKNEKELILQWIQEGALNN